MIRKPDYYKTPLRTRRAITDFIVANTEQRHYDTPHLICFNVKAYHVDLDFNHLLALFCREEGDPLFAHDDQWRKAAKEVYQEVSNDLWDFALEDARSVFDDTDCYNHLWDGTPVNVAYSFEGRSGGWLSLNRFDGVSFTEEHDLAILLNCQSYRWLRRLYQLIVMLVHDLRSEAVESEIEHHAAFNLFENCCADIPRPDALQLKLAFAE